MVYELLHEHDLCTYYDLNRQPGTAQRIQVRKDKFSFLEDARMQQPFISFKDAEQTHILFYIPNIHCSSCLWLLENLHKLDEGVQQVQVNFTKKEARIVFRHAETSMRSIAETLTSIGYEPYISLEDLRPKKPKTDRKLIYQLGVAGFCFANIMLLSFPEYFSGESGMDDRMSAVFRYLNLSLSLPVFFYSAQSFYRSAWGGLKHGFINIDAPVVLAVIVTFIRSVTDVIAGTGAGYFDSMTGIVMFMLIGRILQDKTYQGLSFDRDYTAYFPISVTVIKNEQEIPVMLPDVKTGDTLRIHHQELIPADGILVKGKVLIDYSFVTGESTPVAKQMGEIIYAGGRQLEGNMELLTIKEVAQSYLTNLWNRDELKEEKKSISFIHLLGRGFGWIVLLIAAVTALYWGIFDSSKIWPSVTSVLIVACPCALLLTASFTNGHILRILSRHQLFLRNAQAIETLAATDHIVFDKTGTLTTKGAAEAVWHGRVLSATEQYAIASVAAQSQHPASRALYDHYGRQAGEVMNVHEETGRGMEGRVNGVSVCFGSSAFTGAPSPVNISQTTVHVNIDHTYAGYYTIHQTYREGIATMLQHLPYPVSVLTGDHNGEAATLREIAGKDAELRFYQQPSDKLDYIISIQQKGRCVLMIGDGLNDAGALRQSNTGISLAENSNNFTPASDGILEAAQLKKLPAFIRLCKTSRRIIIAAFIYSTIYNITGLYFAVQGLLSPLIAAILMPSSSISIILLTYAWSEIAGRHQLKA